MLNGMYQEFGEVQYESAARAVGKIGDVLVKCRAEYSKKTSGDRWSEFSTFDHFLKKTNIPKATAYRFIKIVECVPVHVRLWKLTLGKLYILASLIKNDSTLVDNLNQSELESSSLKDLADKLPQKKPQNDSVTVPAKRVTQQLSKIAIILAEVTEVLDSTAPDQLNLQTSEVEQFATAIGERLAALSLQMERFKSFAEAS